LGEFQSRRVSVLKSIHRGNKARNEFFSGFPGAIDSQLEPVRKTISSVKTSDNTVGVVGYCWGYKVLVKSDSKDYAALAGAHPS
jgi:dienelactone hydrolase